MKCASIGFAFVVPPVILQELSWSGECRFTVKAQQWSLSAVKFIHSSTGVLIMCTCFLLRSYETEILMANTDFEGNQLCSFFHVLTCDSDEHLHHEDAIS